MYGYKKETNYDFETTLSRTTEELQKEGFGVLTEIDVKATFKKKLNVEFKNYKILGACNPSSAYEALQVENDIGLMLPCNIIVYEEKGKSYVSAILPTVGMSIVDNKALEKIAEKIEEKLKRVIDKI